MGLEIQRKGWGGGRTRKAERVSGSGEWLNPCLDHVWLYKSLCISPGEEQRQLFVLRRLPLPGYSCDGSCCSQGEDRNRFLKEHNSLRGRGGWGWGEREREMTVREKIFHTLGEYVVPAEAFKVD